MSVTDHNMQSSADSEQAKHRSLFRDYLASLRNPGFWIYATWLELASKYRRSRLGLFWVFFPPVAYMFGVGGFFSKIMGRDPYLFIPHLGMGYLIFRLITVTLGESTTTFSGHSNFILDGRGRLTDYVLRVFSKAFFYFVVALPVLGVALWLASDFQLAGILPSLLGFVLVLLNIAWMVILVAVLGARLPDVTQLIGSALMFSFLFTPILWFAADVPMGTLRGTIARANPLFHLVEIVRAPLLNETIEPLTWKYLFVMTVLGWLLASFVYRRYARFVAIWI